MEIDFDKINDEILVNDINHIDDTIEFTKSLMMRDAGAGEFLEKLVDFKIIDRSSAKECLTLSLQARKIRKELDKRRLEIIKPYFEFQKSINAFSKNLKEQLEKIENDLKEKLVAYVEKSKEKGLEFLLNKSIKVDDGKFSTKKEWLFKLENVDKIPREFLCVDKIKIKKAIDQGVRNIPGIYIYETDKFSIRVNNSIEKQIEFDV